MNVTFTEPDFLFTELWRSCDSLDFDLTRILIDVLQYMQDMNSWVLLVLP